MKFNFTQLSLVFLIAAQLSFAQQMPINFSDSSENFTTFGGSGFSFHTDPDDSGNDVGKFYNNGATWQGFTLSLERPIDLDFQKTISLSFYGYDANAHTILLKLEDGVNADVEVTQNVASGGGWTTGITFDFANAVLSSDGTTPINASGAYDRLTIFIDGNVTTAGTYLLDDIDDGSVETDPNALDVIYDTLVWEDNFDTPGVVNPTNWHYQTQVIIPGIGWANGEEQHYTNRIDNSFVDTSGNLNIVAKDEIWTDQGLTKNYTSARLNSKFAFTYGRVDVRAKLPSDDGTWPAIWTLGKNIYEQGAFWHSSYGTWDTRWPYCGEIDIMEHGLGALNHVAGSIHTPSSSGATINTSGIDISDVNDWHIYSMNWSPNQITFLVDGVGFYTYNPSNKNDDTWPFYEDQFILLNLAMGGYSGTIDSNFTQTSMIVDYVRVYQEAPLSVGADLNLDRTLRVFPNPTTEKIRLSAKTTLTRLALYDVYGKLILKKENDTENLDVSHLNSGIYFLEIYSNTEKVIKKVIVN